jgi:hypothetical protein
MTTFSEAFRSTRDLCISEGRRPVVCLLGPDEQIRFKKFCGYCSPFTNGITLKTARKPDDIGDLCGIRIRKMDCNGMAFLTVPMPESGFDLP